jgi:hypothetical protein
VPPELVYLLLTNRLGARAPAGVQSASGEHVSRRAWA